MKIKNICFVLDVIFAATFIFILVVWCMNRSLRNDSKNKWHSYTNDVEVSFYTDDGEIFTNTRETITIYYRAGSANWEWKENFFTNSNEPWPWTGIDGGTNEN